MFSGVGLDLETLIMKEPERSPKDIVSQPRILGGKFEIAVGQSERKNPSGAEALVQFMAITARVNSCPFKTAST